MDENDIALIKSREINKNNMPTVEAIELFKTNKECQEYNKIIHKTLFNNLSDENCGVLSQAWDRIQGIFI